MKSWDERLTSTSDIVRLQDLQGLARLSHGPKLWIMAPLSPLSSRHPKVFELAAQNNQSKAPKQNTWMAPWLDICAPCAPCAPCAHAYIQIISCVPVPSTNTWTLQQLNCLARHIEIAISQAEHHEEDDANRKVCKTLTLVQLWSQSFQNN